MALPERSTALRRAAAAFAPPLDRRLCVAPMMEHTDRHCRFLHRLFSPHALLYTEMIVSSALVRGGALRLLEHDARERPVALQLGGSDPLELGEAARLGIQAGFAEINLNVGCPSDRVRSAAFGACLMLQPERVAQCARSMRAATAGAVPITVKCRIGVDQLDSYEFFERFVDIVAPSIDALIVHARAALLSGLSPKENREIPPLKYEYVHRLKRERPQLPVILNGGLCEVEEVARELARGLDGVMLGRAAYHRPVLLAQLEHRLIDADWRVPAPRRIIEQMVPYAEEQMRRGVRLHSIARHLSGLLAGQEGARAWRRFLSERAAHPGAPADTLLAALPLLERAIAA
ncbi:MAG TPA: tRNA dihydrouridine(20/20a) synthase DusA [Steroidobacteraceae bacterium]|nr:tRNA dihydrouridine(20/20a) synthase DusA [Steroidobacteraceae bacterium]